MQSKSICYHNIDAFVVFMQNYCKQNVRQTPGGVLPYMALTGMCGQIGYGFQPFFVLNGVSISSLFVLNRVSLHLSGKSVHSKFVKTVQKSQICTFLIGADA